MKRLTILLVLGLIVLSFVACSTSSPVPAPAPTSAPTTAAKPTSTPTAAAARTKLVLASYAITQSGYPYTVTISDMLNKEANVDITVRASTGPMAIVPAVDEGTGDIGIGILSTASQGYYGIADFTGAKPCTNLRQMIAVAPFKMSWVTSVKTGVKTIPDLKGKRITKYTAQPDTHTYAFLEAYGLDVTKDVTQVKIANSGAATAEMAQGRIDASSDRLAGAKMISLQEETGAPAIALPVEPDKFAWAANKYPAVFVALRAGYYEPGEQLGLELKRVPCMVTVDTLYVNKNVSEDVVYSMVKTMIKNVTAMAGMSMESKNLTAGIAVPVSPIPYHPGSIKAFKEFGLWTADHEKAQQRALNNTTWDQWFKAG